MADTGWLDTDTVVHADRPSSSGTGWTNPENAQEEDSNLAVFDISPNDYSDWLRGYNLASFIPPESTINGIEVRIKRRAETATDVRDDAVYLHKSGSTSGDNKWKADMWPYNLGWSEIYGGPTDMWNSGYNWEDIVDSGFGVQISARNTFPLANEYEARVDVMQIKIYYTEPHRPMPTSYNR